MTRILLVDDAAALAELFAQAVRERCDVAVDVAVAVADVELFLADAAAAYDMALVDLSFPQEAASGLDALAQIHERCPDTRLAVMTQGDSWVGAILRDAWDLLPIATVISKTAPLEYQIGMIRAVLRNGTAPIDPAIQTLLPAAPNRERSAERFGRLIQHQGHAKVWRVLLDRSFDATYRNVASGTGLKLNTVKNYRSQLLGELRVHGLHDPSLREMQEFAWRCRAFLAPFVESALAGRE